jgi:predicted nucleic acid-binding protein
MKFYLDTCIWLNIYKKNEKKKEFEESKKLIEKLLFNNKHKIYYSGFILKELRHKLSEKSFQKIRLFLRNEKTIFIKANEQDYELARKFEKSEKNNISFFDYLHFSLCKNRELVFVTRDKELLNFSKDKINAFRPDELLERIDFI